MPSYNGEFNLAVPKEQFSYRAKRDNLAAAKRQFSYSLVELFLQPLFVFAQRWPHPSRLRRATLPPRGWRGKRSLRTQCLGRLRSAPSVARSGDTFPSRGRQSCVVSPHPPALIRRLRRHLPLKGKATNSELFTFSLSSCLSRISVSFLKCSCQTRSF